MLKFFWNGIKGSDGKLQKASYSDGQLISYPAGTLTIYAKGYTHFYGDVAAAFKLENNSDSQTDYFETDTIRVLPSHPLHSQVLAALKAREARYNAKYNIT